jgi:putative toxin-antitoxin system antitoxin component (TIGR02293 family)
MPQVGRLRVRLGTTQEQFAHLLGVSWPSVSRWERGVARPDPITGEKLSHLAHVLKMLEGVIVQGDVRRWLERPHPGLRGHKPVDLLSNVYGFEEVRNLIESIKSGQYA